MLRRRQGSVEVFSMSAIDLFASGLGAFIIVSVVLFPYVLNTTRTPPPPPPQAPLQCPEPVECEVCVACPPPVVCPEPVACPEIPQMSCPEPPQPQCPQISCPEVTCPDCPQRSCPEPLTAKPVLIVAMVWAAQFQDIDLHVRDPRGNVFFFRRPNRRMRDFPGVTGELTFDNINGPGAELYSDDTPMNGLHVVCYHYYNHRRRNAVPRVPTQGFIFYNRRVQLPVVTLTRQRARLEVARVTIDGPNATLDTSRAGQPCPYVA